MGSCCWRHCCTAHFTGEPGVPRPFYIDGTDQIGVFLEPAGHAGEYRLAAPVVLRDVAAARAGATRVARRHGDEPPALPAHLVVQLSAELEPALIEGSPPPGRRSSRGEEMLERATVRIRVSALESRGNGPEHVQWRGIHDPAGGRRDHRGEAAAGPGGGTTSASGRIAGGSEDPPGSRIRSPRCWRCSAPLARIASNRRLPCPIRRTTATGYRSPPPRPTGARRGRAEGNRSYAWRPLPPGAGPTRGRHRHRCAARTPLLSFLPHASPRSDARPG